MKFLTGLARTILGLLLFLFLSIFGVALTINQTILNPDFVVSQVDKLDISSLAKEVLSEKIPLEREFVDKVLDNVFTDLKPWIKEQTKTITYASYDYLLGKSQSLSVEIPLEPAKERLKSTLKEAISQSPPQQLAGLPPAIIEQFFDKFYQDLAKGIPSTFKFNKGSLPPNIQAMLEQARQAIGYFQVGYKALIGFILFLILCIILVNREVKGATRKIGTIFLSCGVIEFAGIFAAKYFAGTQISELGIPIPTYFQEWLPQFLNDLLAPLQMFSIVLLACGIVLVIVSFIFKPREQEPAF